MSDRIDFQQLRERFPVKGKPMPVRTARELAARLTRIKVGKHIWFPLASVEAFEKANTIQGN